MRVIRDVILCKDCALRKTSGCPMAESTMDQSEMALSFRFRDRTTDYGFCHMGAIRTETNAIVGESYTTKKDQRE